MDTCLDPILYLQTILNEELKEVLGLDGNFSNEVAQGLQVKRKPNDQGDVHIPAFTRKMKTLMNGKKDAQVDIYTVPSRLLSSPTINTYIRSIDISTNEHLNLRLNKITVTKAVITNVLSNGDAYGKQITPENSVASCSAGVPHGSGLATDYVINGTTLLGTYKDSANELSSLDHLRIIITLGYITNILTANGSSVRINNLVLQEDLISASQSTLQTRELFNGEITVVNEQNTVYQEAFKDIELKVKDSDYVGKGRNASRSSSINTNPGYSPGDGGESVNNTDDHLLYFDCKQYRKDSSFQPVLITGDLINRVATLEYNTRITTTKEDSCLLHVTSSKKMYACQQLGTIWEAFSNSSSSKRQMYMSLDMTSVHNNQLRVGGLVNMDDLIRIREGQLRSAYLLKYGDNVKGAGWDSSIKSVAIATLKLQIMSAAQKNQVRIDISEEAQDYRQSTFIMYNCARLAKLFHHYEQSVEQGLYPPLPGIDKIDFSLLREKEEWNLLVRYVMTFPSAVREAAHGFKSRHTKRVAVHINKICCFLLNLSQDFSSYYGRTHVLGEPRPHLFPTMFARLYLLKAVEQVLHNGLALFDIQPLTQM